MRIEDSHILSKSSPNRTGYRNTSENFDLDTYSISVIMAICFPDWDSNPLLEGDQICHDICPDRLFTRQNLSGLAFCIQKEGYPDSNPDKFATCKRGKSN